MFSAAIRCFFFNFIYALYKDIIYTASLLYKCTIFQFNLCSFKYSKAIDVGIYKLRTAVNCNNKYVQYMNAMCNINLIGNIKIINIQYNM